MVIPRYEGCSLVSKQASTKSKELKIITRHVVTVNDVLKDPRKIKLLYLIKEFGEISEKALQYLVYWLKSEKGVDLGYDFLVIGNVPSSKDLKMDIVALLYVGALETNPKNKKLRVTGIGEELLGKVDIDKEELEKLVSNAKDFEAKVRSIDAEVELVVKMLSSTRRRRRRFI